MEVLEGRSDLHALFQGAQALRNPQVIKITGQNDQTETEVLLVPAGMAPKSVKEFLDPYRKNPERRKGTATVQDLPSFIELVNRFKDEDSALFADPNAKSPKVTAVINYNHAGEEAKVPARFGDHRVLYPCPLSKEWLAWMANDGEKMSQTDFAYFLEERIGDISVPVSVEPIESEPQSDKDLRELLKVLGGTCADAAKLMELSRGFKVIVNDTVAEARNLSTGETELQFTSQHADERGQPLRIPNLFLVAIPVFEMGALYRIPVRLRYRITNGKPSWFYELLRADKVFDHAFKEVCVEASAGTALPLFVGTPE